MRTILTEGRAAALTRPALDDVERAFPSDRHGWARGCWTLARLLRRFPVATPAGEIRALFDRRLTPVAVAGDLADLRGAASRGDEAPPGWAWLLKLAAELRGLDDQWGAALAPLAEAVRDRSLAVLPRGAAPVRAGTRGNTAFALTLARDYAVATADDELLGLLWERAVDWYGRDRACPAREPSGNDALSPALTEAECMRRLLPAAQWRSWFDGFLPELAEGRPETLFRPAAADGTVANRDALNLSRAWCWRGAASGLTAGDPRRAAMEAAAERHLGAALGQAVGDGTGPRRGDHRLASFALLALEA